MDENVLKGKRITTIIVCIVGGLSLLSLILNTVSENYDLTSTIRTIITLSIMFFIYSGKNWARILFIVLTAIGGIFSLFGGVVIMLVSIPLGILTIIVAIINIAIAIILGTNSSVKEYFKYSN